MFSPMIDVGGFDGKGQYSINKVHFVLFSHIPNNFFWKTKYFIPIQPEKTLNLRPTHSADYSLNSRVLGATRRPNGVLIKIIYLE